MPGEGPDAARGAAPQRAVGMGGVTLTTWVVMPTYNEIHNLRPMAETLLGLVLPSRADQPRCLHLLIVDDNSPDGTGALADAIVAEHPGRVEVLHRPEKDGLGRAYLAGFRLAVAAGADEIVHMDADFSHRPDDFLRLLGALRDCDVAVGSRWVRGGKLDANWELWRYNLSKWANVYARFVTGLRVHDATAGFKAFRRDALARIDFTKIHANGYVFHIELALAAQRAGLRVEEVPIHFDERRTGASKMSWGIIFEAVKRVWLLRWVR